jgi:hypothetical protein
MSFFAFACSNVNSGEKSGDAPVISNLHIFTDSVHVEEEGKILAVQGSIDFTDSAGDITALRLVATDGTELTTPIAGMTGKKEGTISGIIKIPLSSMDDQSFEIWLIDRENNSSNRLSGSLKTKREYIDTQWRA